MVIIRCFDACFMRIVAEFCRSNAGLFVEWTKLIGTRLAWLIGACQQG